MPGKNTIETIHLDDQRQVAVTVVEGEAGLADYLAQLDKNQQQRAKARHSGFFSQPTAHQEYVLCVSGKRKDLFRISFPQKEVRHFDVEFGRGPMNYISVVQDNLAGSHVTSVSLAQRTPYEFSANQTLVHGDLRQAILAIEHSTVTSSPHPHML